MLQSELQFFDVTTTEVVAAYEKSYDYGFVRIPKKISLRPNPGFRPKKSAKAVAIKKATAFKPS